MTHLTRTDQQRLARLAQEIKRLGAQVAEQTLTMGQRLQEAKALLPHGQWRPWLAREFRWSEITAQRLMQVATRFKSITVTDLPIEPAALYVLAAPSTPEPALQEAVRLAQQGEVISQRTARQLRALYRPPQLGLPPAPVADPAPKFFDDVPLDDFEWPPSASAPTPEPSYSAHRPQGEWRLLLLAARHFLDDDRDRSISRWREGQHTALERIIRVFRDDLETQGFPPTLEPEP